MKKEEILESISKEKLEDMYNAILSAKEAEQISKENLVEKQTLVREEIAKVNQAYKKDGVTLDLSVAPAALVKSALEVLLTKVNKLEAKLDTQQEILAMYENGNVQRDIVDSYASSINAEQGAKNDTKDIVDELKSVVDKEIVEAISLLADKRIKEQIEDQDDSPKSKTQKTDSSETIKGILQILNEG